MNHHQNALEALAQLSHVAGLIDTAECKDEGLYNRLQSALAVSNAALDDAMKALAAAPQVVADERALPFLPKPAAIKHPTDDTMGCVLFSSQQMQDYARATLAAAPVQAQEPRKTTDISKRLREWACERAIAAHYADLMLVAADEIERYYVGMMNWKATAEAKDSAPVQPVAVPDGWKLVPEELTPTMLDVSDAGERTTKKVWRDMLAVAPAAPAAQGDATQATIDVLAERRRQVDGEGWTAAQDDNYTAGQLAKAAASYCLYQTASAPGCWPWNRDYWKPKGYRANMVRAGALILAEIDRIDRAAIAAKAAS